MGLIPVAGAKIDLSRTIFGLGLFVFATSANHLQNACVLEMVRISDKSCSLLARISQSAIVPEVNLPIKLRGTLFNQFTFSTKVVVDLYARGYLTDKF